MRGQNVSKGCVRFPFNGPSGLGEFRARARWFNFKRWVVAFVGSIDHRVFTRVWCCRLFGRVYYRGLQRDCLGFTGLGIEGFKGSGIWGLEFRKILRAVPGVRQVCKGFITGSPQYEGCSHSRGFSLTRKSKNTRQRTPAGDLNDEFSDPGLPGTDKGLSGVGDEAEVLALKVASGNNKHFPCLGSMNPPNR